MRRPESNLQHVATACSSARRSAGNTLPAASLAGAVTQSMPFPPRSWLNWETPTASMACTWRQALAGSLKKNKEPFDKWCAVTSIVGAVDEIDGCHASVRAAQHRLLPSGINWQRSVKTVDLQTAQWCTAASWARLIGCCRSLTSGVWIAPPVLHFCRGRLPAIQASIPTA